MMIGTKDILEADAKYPKHLYGLQSYFLFLS